MTQNFDLTRGYFGDAHQVHLPMYFRRSCIREVRKNDGVVACEGSMFKSKFANALTTMMIGALGIAAAQNKLSVGYGAEAGAMDPLLQKMCTRYCRDSLVITRNVESQEVLGKLGVAHRTRHGHRVDLRAARPGIRPQGAARRRMGRTTPVLAVCPINPFWWPVKPSLAKWIAHSPWPAPTRKATTARFIFTTPAATWMPPTKNIFPRWPRASTRTENRAQCFR